MARIVQVGGGDADHRVLDRILHRAGQPPVRALLPADALHALHKHAVDLLLLDVMQPSDDVLALMKTAQTANGRGGKVPVIVVGPPTAVDRLHACLQRGADDYLTRPFEPAYPALVTSRVDALLERYPVATVERLSEAATITRRLTTAPVRRRTVPPVERFVPHQFLDLLERKSLDDLKLGDHVERDMTVFFSDIADFAQLSESLTPQENFRFLSSYLRNVIPIIRGRGGFIDKFLGDGVMALFPGDAYGAVRAAVDLLRQIERYNLGRAQAGYVPIRIGMGLHRGALMLGTIGDEDQMQTTVTADVVSMASRIKAATSPFGVDLLLSAAVVRELPPAHGFHLRAVGAVKAKGKGKGVEIFECYDNDPPELIEHKDRTSKQFAAGIASFRSEAYLPAGNVFGHIAQMNRSDTVAAYYRDRCALLVFRGRGSERHEVAERVEV